MSDPDVPPPLRWERKVNRRRGCPVAQTNRHQRRHLARKELRRGSERDKHRARRTQNQGRRERFGVFYDDTASSFVELEEEVEATLERDHWAEIDAELAFHRAIARLEREEEVGWW